MSASSSSHILPNELVSKSQRNNDSYKKPSFVPSYRWNPNMTKPYPQAIEHELVIEYWVRHIQLFENHNIAEALLLVMTTYSVPAFIFKYFNDKSIGIYNNGRLCHQLLQKKRSVLFGPRVQYKGIDMNMFYKFRFRVVSGNISFGICPTEIKLNQVLHDMRTVRHAMIWRNGYYHYNLKGTDSYSSIQKGHVEDIYKNNDIIEFQLNLVKLKCFVVNVTNPKILRHELPIRELVNYKGSSGYLQIVIGFFNDYGGNAWIKSAGCVQVIDQRAEYVPSPLLFC